MTEQNFTFLEHALAFCKPAPAWIPPELPDPMEQVLSLREAGLADSEILPLSQAEGRICASVQVPCPPAVPIAVSGERLTKKWLDFMAFYGLSSLSVVRNS